ncbi:MAG: LysM domain-containing protein [Clostridiales bacterium]|nr:LysM domain-containing protein [Clostridiales bacterium]
MNNCNMRFKGFEFEINPSNISVKSNTFTKELPIPMNAHIIQELGFKPRYISGNGIFTGENCNEKFADLQAIFNEGGKGDLFISGYEPMVAIMTSLEFSGKSGKDGICYCFEFIEYPENPKEQNGRIHIVSEGETLFDIANLYNTSVDTLLSLNPHLPAPFELVEKDRVILR